MDKDITHQRKTTISSNLAPAGFAGFKDYCEKDLVEAFDRRDNKKKNVYIKLVSQTNGECMIMLNGSCEWASFVWKIEGTRPNKLVVIRKIG